MNNITIKYKDKDRGYLLGFILNEHSKFYQAFLQNTPMMNKDFMEELRIEDLCINSDTYQNKPYYFSYKDLKEKEESYYNNKTAPYKDKKKIKNEYTSTGKRKYILDDLEIDQVGGYMKTLQGVRFINSVIIDYAESESDDEVEYVSKDVKDKDDDLMIEIKNQEYNRFLWSKVIEIINCLPYIIIKPSNDMWKGMYRYSIKEIKMAAIIANYLQMDILKILLHNIEKYYSQDLMDINDYNIDIIKDKLKKNPKDIIYIPEELQTKEMWYVIIRNYNFMTNISSNRTRILILIMNENETIENHNTIMSVVHSDIKKKKALLHTKSLIIPKRFESLELYKEILKYSPISIYYIPKKYMSDEMYKIMVSNKSYGVKFVPKEKITKELYELAIKSNKEAIPYIPDEYITTDLYEIIAKLYGLRYIPDVEISKELCKIAVTHSPREVKFVPDIYLDDNICFLAIKHSRKAINYIPKEIKTKEFYDKAIIYNGDILYKIPKEHITENICKNAIIHNGINYQFVPQKYRTKEMYELAIKNSANIIKEIGYNK